VAVTEDEGVSLAITHIEDVTEQRRIAERLHWAATHDDLTGLPNRTELITRVDEMLVGASMGEVALLFIDLDNFKDLNDTLGHDMGDQLLQQVAQRLSSHVREEDTLARLGGDEFVLMLEGLHQQHPEAIAQIETVATKLIQVLGEPYVLQGRSHTSTASIGIALFSEAQGTMDELLKRADLAMYEAKAGGRNTLRFFNPEMQAEVSARANLESDLRQSHPALPASGQPAGPTARRRSAGALAAPQSRPGGSGGIHPAGGKHRPDPAPGPLDPAQRLPATGGLGRRSRA
jgi:diguanylate cyclase (GGDEF)-like protein